MPELLQLELFGGLRVRLSDEPVTGFVSSKGQALLCYLAVTRRPHFRPALAAMFWGELPDADAATNLRQAVANLRRLFEPHLLITRQTIGFNTAAPYYLDVEAFEHDLRALDAPADARDPASGDDAQLGVWGGAVDRYTGDFLEGFLVRDAPAFDEWALAQRERLRDLGLRALRALMLRRTARGEHQAAIACATRLLSLDPWREEAHRQLMLLLARDGQRGAALAQYEDCRRVLRDGLGIDPMPETSALYERIRAAQPVSRRTVPAEPTPLVGREAERAELARTLANPGVRLLTIAGPGGIGKTRLALQVAADLDKRFLHGSHLVALAPIDSADLLATTVVGALQWELAGRAPPQTQLLNYLREKDLLLVLDNFEHLIERGAELLAEIMRHAPDVKLLVTSRERLHLQGEHLLELRGLAAPPESTDAVEAYGAADLFTRSARSLRADFALPPQEARAVGQICRLVEGMPLAIELAAAWTRVLSCEEIAQEIARNLGFLSTSLRDVPARHRSMRAVFAYSWQFLSAEERAAMRWLSVFRGGFTREAVSHVTRHEPNRTLNVLATLLDKSLLRRIGAGRYDMHELVRQYANERLREAPDEHDQVYARHCAYFVALLQRHQEQLRKNARSEALAQIGAEVENVRAAWRWALAARHYGHIDAAAEGLYLLFMDRAWFQEGADTFGQAVEALSGAAAGEADAVLAKLLGRQGIFNNRLARFAQATELLQQALAHARRLSLPREIVFSLNTLGSVAWGRGAYHEAQQLASESQALALKIGDLTGQGTAINNLTIIAFSRGEYAEARRLGLELLALRRASDDRYGTGVILNNLANATWELGEYDEAEQYYHESLAIFREIKHRSGYARTLLNIADIARVRRRYAEARSLFQECLDTFRETGEQRSSAYALAYLGDVTSLLGEHSAAKQMLEEGLAIYRAIGNPEGIAATLCMLGEVLCELEVFTQAEDVLREALCIALRDEAVPIALQAVLGVSKLALKQGRRQVAAELLHHPASHPASDKYTLDRAARMLSDLEAQLSPELLRAARERGRDRSFDEVAAALRERAFF